MKLNQPQGSVASDLFNYPQIQLPVSSGSPVAN